LGAKLAADSFAGFTFHSFEVFAESLRRIEKNKLTLPPRQTKYPSSIFNL
jgi:hypothetical protein